MRRVVVFTLIAFVLSLQASAYIVNDTLKQTGKVRKSVYPDSIKEKSSIYNKLWGKHYRKLYTLPITVTTINFDSFLGGVKVVSQADNFHGLVLEDKEKHLYMLKPLGGSTSFLESDFFQEMYNKKDFNGTYLDTFIGDAYTIINPYTFLASDFMAQHLSLSSNNPRIYYIPKYTTADTIADGSYIQAKLVSITDIPDINTKKNILSTTELLEVMRKDKSYFVDQHLYIRERLFDMLIGDWNKMPENWNWNAQRKNDSILFSPIVIDRNHAFTKVDGLFFKQMLSVLTLGFISNYEAEFKKLKNFNKLGYELDLAIVSQSDESLWIQEAKWLKNNFTDQLIEEAFDKLPKGVESSETDNIKRILKARRDNVEELAHTYYRILQHNPIVTGTERDDHFIIDRSRPDSVHISIYDSRKESLVFDKKYEKKTAKEIWLYGLQGNDHFEIKHDEGRPLKVLLITGEGENSYDFQSKKNLKVYAYPSEKQTFDSISGVRPVFSENERVVGYDYKHTKYSKFSFSPWGFYDSDLGINLGSYVTYTMYGYKRMPFSYQHRLGFNYLGGFMYRGIFPTYDERKTFIVDAEFGFPRNFFNFFGFGNNTDGYKDEKRNYNRVNIRNLVITPSYNITIDKRQELSFIASAELVKVLHPSNKFINTIYSKDHRVFKTNYFADLSVRYQVNKEPSSIISKLEGEVIGGWKLNMGNAKRNFPYAEVKGTLDICITDRFTWATMAKAKALFTDKFEFYQAATTELRGFRNNRFLGKQSFYQYSDFRVDMGELKNPFTPLKYGLFAGIDYGRVWYPDQSSKKWHTSYGGGIWLTLINKITTKYSLFGSKDSVRFMFELGLGF